MWYIIIGIIVLGVIAAIAGYFRNKKLQQMLERGEISEIPEAREIPEECCGQHETKFHYKETTVSPYRNKCFIR